MTSGEHNRITGQTQEGFNISLDAQADQVKQAWVRFGTIDPAGNHKWEASIALKGSSVSKGQKKIIASVYDDQLPAKPQDCFYQILCEVEGPHGDPVTLITEPTPLA
ncbi:protein of unknown function [Nitrospira japonica]|uniref:Uncharacterized protein n=1 Tax=Nitrospira japonica TaxID=1325564 RepID=A0A1W1I7V9_9BACT|nr:hypothetical protein [Nitrospira japonica]SLM49096.1 protein of unknown function [Nitrospira japonica]